MNLTLWPAIGIIFISIIIFMNSKFSFRSVCALYAFVATATLTFWPYESIVMQAFKYQQRASFAQSLVYLVMAVLLIGERRLMRGLVTLISWVFMLDAVAILFGFWGITWGLSFDAAFIVLMLPIFYKPTMYHRVITALALMAVWKVGGATSYLVMAGLITGAAISYRNWLWLTILPVLFCIGYYSQGQNLWLSQGRLDMWSAYFLWFINNSNHYLGSGLGSFEWLGQMIYFDTVGAYTFAHNDYLQVLFEMGIVGLVLFTGTLLEALWRLRNEPLYFSTALGFCAFMLTYSPLHVFPGMMVGILLLGESRDAQQV